MPITAEIGSHIVLSGLPPATRTRLKDELTISNPAYWSAVRFGGTPRQYIAIPQHIQLWRESSGKLAIPRGISFTPATGLYKMPMIVKDNRHGGLTVPFPPFVRELYCSQEQVVDSVVNDANSAHPVRRYGTYLIVKPVSGGKTTIGAAIAAKLGQITLVLVHTKEIMRAWKNELPALFGPDIGIGFCGGSSRKPTIGTQFTIATPQKLYHMTEQERASFYAHFGCVIMDECHHAPARVFYDIVTNIPALYRIGITGTKQRADKLQSIMYRVFGTPFYEEKDRGEETISSIPISDVIVRKTSYQLPDKRKKKVKVRGQWKEIEVDVDPTDNSFAQMCIANDVDRDKLICADVVQQLRAGNNICLAVCSRVDHVHRLAHMIAERTAWSGAILIGETPLSERDQINRLLHFREIRWLVATYQVIYEGANIRPINRLFMAFSASDPSLIKQLFGRARRKFQDKHDVLVFDYADMNVPVLRKQYLKRTNLYREMNIKRFVNVFSG